MSRTHSARVVPSLGIVLACISFSSHAQAALVFSDVAPELGVEVESNSYWGAGVAFFDIDGDGDLDLYVVDGDGDPNLLFRNDGNRVFTEVGSQAGVNSSTFGKAVVPADIDNDGDADLLLTSYNPSDTNLLFRNDGGTFVDITSGSGFDFTGFSTGAAWADYDGDGLLDCYVGRYQGQRDYLLHNMGGGVFQDVAQTLGVDNQNGWTYQPAWFDYDFDGDLDLYVGNDDFFGGEENRLFRNDGGVFTDVSVASGAGISIATMGLAIADYDNDVDLDIYITNLAFGNVLLRNDGGVFTDVTAENGVAVNYICWGADFFDADNDGWLDLYVNASQEDGNPRPVGTEARGGGSLGAENRLFENLDGSGFADVSVASGTNNTGPSFCSAVGDYDEDGDLDLYVTNYWEFPGDEPSSFYENEHHPRGTVGDDFLRVDLIGTISKRDAVGAKVWILTSNGWQLRERRAGTGFLSSSESTLHFGLGNATTVERLFVQWPSGLAEEYQSIPAGTILTLVEGDGVPSDVDTTPAVKTGWSFVSATPNPVRETTRISLRGGAAPALVEVRDIQGRLVRTLAAPGATEFGGDVGIEWDRSDAQGRSVASGSYFLRLVSQGRTVDARRVLVLPAR